MHRPAWLKAQVVSYQICLNKVQVNFKPGVHAQELYPGINAQVVFHFELYNAWLYAQGFLPTPFEWNIGHFLIPGFDA